MTPTSLTSPPLQAIEKVRNTPAPLPWQDRPKACDDLIWRYNANPIITRNQVSLADGIYNSAVVRHGDGFRGVFRLDHKTGLPNLHAGRSTDGIAWAIDRDPIALAGAHAEIAHAEWRYDPRLVPFDDGYYLVWCNDYHGPTIGLAWTKDFQNYRQLENAFLPYNRNGVLFPRLIGGMYAMLSRPSDNGHTGFGDIFYSESPDLTHWGRHRFVMGKGGGWWQDHKIGPGPAPIETRQGWLMFYHGVARSCNGLIYRTGIALLDLEQPWKVLARSPVHIFGPRELYETSGNVANVCFPCAVLHDAPTGRLAIYYGAADTCTGLAFAQVDALLEHLAAYRV